jgi:hypothetical protein
VGVRAAGLAFLGSGVPEVRSNTGNAYFLGVEVGSVSGAHALPVVSVQGEASFADEAFSGVGVPDSGFVAGHAEVVGVEVGGVGRALAEEGFGVEDEARVAANAGEGAGVPNRRSVAGHAESSCVDVSEAGRAHTCLLGSVINLIGGTGLTSIGLVVPPRGRSAGAPPGGVDSGEVGGADAGLLDCVVDLIGGTGLAKFGLFVEELGGSTPALAFRSRNGVWGAADLEGPSGRGSSRTNTLKQPAVKNVASRTAVEAGALVMAERKSLGAGDEGQHKDDGFLHKIFQIMSTQLVSALNRCNKIY